MGSYEKLKLNRPNSKCFNCALGSFDEDNTYIWGDFSTNLMGSVGGKRLGQSATVRILMRSLQSILDEVGLTHINLFSLDTEGYEYNILQGIDFNRTTFDYLLIELYPEEYGQVCSFLDERGYEMVEPYSFYDYQNTPNWDGTHNDYLFKPKLCPKPLTEGVLN